MSDLEQPTFLVSAYSVPVAIRIDGKANYLNCNAFREFIEQMLEQGISRFAVDFSLCKGMDSTFLGILASAALELRKQSPPGSLVLCKLSTRNNELIHNLGLQNLLTIASDCDTAGCNGSGAEFASLEDREVSDARAVLRAHESLAEVDAENAAKFQDVIAFLKNQAESDETN